MKDNETATILIIDDEPRNLRVLSDTLSNAGFEVASAMTGSRGVEIAKIGLPDLILLDVRMAGMDGFETCRHLKEDPTTRDIPVIFLTASSDSPDKVRGLSLGAVDFILKPFHDEELLARVQVHTKLRRVMVKLEAQIKERLAAEAALQKLTYELERRVAERTADLKTALDGLTQAQAQMATVIRAAQAVAAEVVLDKVLDRLLRITLEHAEARRCVLILARESGMVIEASITRDHSDEPKLGLSTRMEQNADLCLRLIEETTKTKESVLVWDTGLDARLANDPYLRGKRPMSILSLAMIYQGELTGVLYIESDAVSDPFTSTQIETLRLLASQAAVGVKVALLYSALRKSNDRLENEVARQTDELLQTNERLRFELAERERAEKERASLQEEIIRAQDARLAELSTPLIPIMDQIVVMPLIGTIDASRARRVLEVALEGVHASGANVVIIDVTGVTMIDAAVANTLVSTAAALRMLGAKAIITGIRSQLASALASLNVDLTSVVTKGTLASGIAYALMQVGTKR